MKLIPQSEVDRAAEKFDKEVPLGKLTTDYIFKAGVTFAESKVEDIAIEFADWINNNNYWFDQLARNKSDSKTLFQQFLKERNND